MLKITCTTQELADRAKAITDDLERLDLVALSGMGIEIEVGDYNSIDGGDDRAYEVATLYNAIFNATPEDAVEIEHEPEQAPQQSKGVRYVEPVYDASPFQDSYSNRGYYEDA